MARPSSSSSVKIGLPSVFLLAFAGAGWIILIGNLFPIAHHTSGFIPVVDDLTGLIMSTLILLILGLTPTMLRSLFQPSKDSDKKTR